MANCSGRGIAPGVLISMSVNRGCAASSCFWRLF